MAEGLRIDAAAAEVLRGFESTGVAAIVLKGRSLADWLYGPGEARHYLDCDLLVAPSQVVAAEAVLARLGFAKALDETRLPAWWREHGSEWWRAEDGVTVDLHRRLPGVGADAEETFWLLHAGSVALRVGSHDTLALDLPARALHIAVHAAHHGASDAKWLPDLNRALERAGDELWSNAAVLARRLDALESFAAGLRLTAAGATVAAQLQLPAPRSVSAALRASSPPPVALGFEALASAPNMRLRVTILARKLFPPAEFIRHWAPAARAGRRALFWAYVRRPFWLARRAPAGFRAWRRARLDVRAGRSQRPS